MVKYVKSIVELMFLCDCDMLIKRVYFPFKTAYVRQGFVVFVLVIGSQCLRAMEANGFLTFFSQ